jgi:glycosyltransferase involved in cell wall biosynthesis
VNKPLVSVILPVYNGEKYLLDAINSILDQTYDNFELIVLNDCSPDNSRNIILSIQDSRLKLIDNEVNLGLVGSLNKGISNSSGKYIARMDQDDISIASRLEKQVDYLENNVSCQLLGTNYQAIGDYNYTSNLPSTAKEVTLQLHIHNCICHPSVMFRKSVFQDSNLKYNSTFVDCEDYGLWIDMLSKNLELNNLPDILIKYRIGKQSTTTHSIDIRKERLLKVFNHLTNSLYNGSLINNTTALYAISTGRISSISTHSVFLAKKEITKELINKGYDSHKINSLLKSKCTKLAYSVIKRNWNEGLVFAFNHKLLSKNMVKYLLANLKNKVLERFKHT